ncbi:MAG: holo-ACP synthase [Coriobacteriales bacterium]|nr:holo-ACP synthase [Coriobacteriales bacterium]
MAVAGLGVDIVEIDRMERVLQKTPRVKERAFSAAEREYCDSKARPQVHYALRFAAKEAVLKALGTGFRNMRFTDVEVGLDAAGKPYPILHGEAERVAKEAGIVEMHLSLSYTHNVAVANAVAVTQGSKPAPPDSVKTQKEQLAEAFKEARALLDELDEADTKALADVDGGEEAPW